MKKIFAVATAVLCISMYFLWVNAGVRQIALFPYKPNQVSVVLLLAVGVVSMLFSARRKALWTLILRNRTFLALFSIFLLLQLMSLLWAAPHGNFTYVLGKQAAYFLCALLVAAALTGSARAPTLAATYWGLLVGLFLFSAVFAVLSAIVGSGVVTLVTSALIDGDASALQFKVFTLIFNFADGELVGKGDEDFQGTALRNTLVGIFVVTAILFWSRTRSSMSSPFMRSPFLTLVVTLLCGFFILASVSRSNILVFFLAGIVILATSLLYPSRGTRGIKISRWGWGLISIFVLLLSGNIVVGLIDGLTTIGAERFGNLAKEPRLVMYATALNGIDQHIWFGHGLGAEIEVFEHRVHNLFLAAWYEGGIVLFVSALAMYIALVRSIVLVHRRSIALRRVQSEGLLLTPGGMLALSILPLFRPLISGEAGAFTLVEWFCVSLLLAERANTHNVLRHNSLSPSGRIADHPAKI